MGAKKNGGYQIIDMCGIAAGDGTSGTIARESFFLVLNAIKNGKPVLLTNFNIRLGDPETDLPCSPTFATFVQTGEERIFGTALNYRMDMTTVLSDESEPTSVYIIE